MFVPLTVFSIQDGLKECRPESLKGKVPCRVIERSGWQVGSPAQSLAKCEILE